MIFFIIEVWPVQRHSFVTKNAAFLPNTYSINTGVAPTGALLDTFNVAPGTYTITVRDAFGCTDTEVVTVSEVLAATAVRTKDITCSTPAEATIRVDVTGGKADFGSCQLLQNYF